MKSRPTTKIVEGEIYGAPVPGGWPDSGPFRVLRDGLARGFGRRTSGGRGEAGSRPGGENSDSPSRHADLWEPEE